jgi:hypothetical protein
MCRRMEANPLEKLLEIEHTARELAVQAEREAENRIKVLVLRKQEQFNMAVDESHRRHQVDLQNVLKAAENDRQKELEGFERELESLPSTEAEFRVKVRDLLTKGEL